MKILQLAWSIEKGYRFLGNFSVLVFIHKTPNIDDAQLNYIVGNSSTNEMLKKSYVQIHFGGTSYPLNLKYDSFLKIGITYKITTLSYKRKFSFRNGHTQKLIIVDEDALTPSLINSSRMWTGHSLLVTSNKRCNQVKVGIFSHHLRLDTLCYVLCSGSDGIKTMMELYKVIIIIPRKTC